MKKTLLSLLLIAGISTSAQSIVENAAMMESKLLFQELPQHKKEKLIQALQDARNIRYTNKGNKAVAQRMSHVDPVAALKQLNFVWLTNGFFPDSQLTMVTSSGATRVNIHAVSSVLDPNSQAFALAQLDYFAPTDAINIDTVIVYGFYDIATPNLQNFTGDSIRVDIIWGDINNNTTWRTGVQYPANSFPGQTAAIPLTVPRYSGSPNHGFHNGLTATNRVVLHYRLTVSDSAEVEFRLPLPQSLNIPAGNKVAAVVHFKPGYTYQAGDTLYDGNNTTNPIRKNFFRPIYARDPQAQQNVPTFLEAYDLYPQSRAVFGNLFVGTRYGNSANQLSNELISPSLTFAPYIEFFVTGNSTIGKDEFERGRVRVYPNPTNGELNLSVENIQAGRYDVRVVNLLGQVLKSENVYLHDGANFKFDLSGMAKGIYLINITNGTTTLTERITLK
ncbi:hypothetical protein JCM31826_03960 [Thermaurantimonas aggregans]|uniref:Secretion system C-terminal sorting domain-containing protein n=1 Tax=Thermaurantimonas aggregans TaxID=2173829 RepID=A0A401XIW8_9FLAO|nr:T9SS type A sorting domain-containing protein [Thermaurantimonas aggregans]MCX8149805.1 T9SS type A sorting domain-containing protein [Thermaurantimonas aggregans]GCD76914.1 hypothetical protein JCM31826_03960 [Thermaurantimonas aggregans]